MMVLIVFIMAATNGTGITVDTANDKLALYDNDTASVKYVNVSQVAGSSAEWTDGGAATGPLYPAGNSGVQNVIIGSNNIGTANIVLGNQGGATFNEQGNDVDFRVQSENLQGIVLVDAATDALLFGTNVTAAASEVVPPGADVTVYMSGTSGSMGGLSSGLSLVTGDLLVSGTVVLGGERQSNPSEGHALEVSGSSRSGAGNRGRLEYLYGSFIYDLSNPQPRFLPLAKSHDYLTVFSGRSGSMGSSITFPHNGIVKEVRLAISGASGNTNNPGDTRLAFYTSTGATSNVDQIDQGGVGLTFAPPGSGFVRGLSPTVAIPNDDGQSWLFDMEDVFVDKDRLMLLAVGFTTGPNTGTKFHGSYTVVVEYNEFS